MKKRPINPIEYTSYPSLQSQSKSQLNDTKINPLSNFQRPKQIQIIPGRYLPTTETSNNAIQEPPLPPPPPSELIKILILGRRRTYNCNHSNDDITTQIIQRFIHHDYHVQKEQHQNNHTININSHYQSSNSTYRYYKKDITLSRLFSSSHLKENKNSQDKDKDKDGDDICIRLQIWNISGHLDDDLHTLQPVRMQQQKLIFQNVSAVILVHDLPKNSHDLYDYSNVSLDIQTHQQWLHSIHSSINNTLNPSHHSSQQ